MKNRTATIRIKGRTIPRGSFLVGEVVYPFSQLEDVMRAQLSGTPLPTPARQSSDLVTKYPHKD